MLSALVLAAAVSDPCTHVRPSETAMQKTIASLTQKPRQVKKPVKKVENVPKVTPKKAVTKKVAHKVAPIIKTFDCPSEKKPLVTLITEPVLPIPPAMLVPIKKVIVTTVDLSTPETNGPPTFEAYTTHYTVYMPVYTPVYTPVSYPVPYPVGYPTTVTTPDVMMAPSVPEPETWALFMVGLLGVGWMGKRKMKGNKS